MDGLDAHRLLGGNEEHIPIGQHPNLGFVTLGRSDRGNGTLQIQGALDPGCRADAERRRTQWLGKRMSIAWRSAPRARYRPGADIHLGQGATCNAAFSTRSRSLSQASGVSARSASTHTDS